ncbi:hypothetical protein P88_00550 [Erwinia phage phiEt88]|uniref:hypothetical protein n=1 Tax=Erwinia phage phiEt88 TaxID=925984 RepID=UPI0001F1FC87|nr:hypothetical protein ErPhphiEt88_gp55 [Erwinia phage phiEt88]CBX44566.1 hypothetical protein P88_00550 [Erwinia phage phiEt88]
MDYSKLSDYEINCEVGRSICISDYLLARNEQKNYCNNPADAWPIIVSSGISLRKLHNGKWRGINEWGVSHQQDDDKPFRAAMIVYLMMQGGN